MFRLLAGCLSVLVVGLAPAKANQAKLTGWDPIIIPAEGHWKITPRTPTPTETAALSSSAQKKPAQTQNHTLTGIASYYWQDQMTASGERFNKNDLTAAHKTLPLGSKVKVTNLKNGKDVTVRINDRGPFINGRVIDLSEAAAKVLGFTDKGLTDVRVDVLTP